MAGLERAAILKNATLFLSEIHLIKRIVWVLGASVASDLVRHHRSACRQFPRGGRASSAETSADRSGAFRLSFLRPSAWAIGIGARAELGISKQALPDLSKQDFILLSLDGNRFCRGRRDCRMAVAMAGFHPRLDRGLDRAVPHRVGSAHVVAVLACREWRFVKRERSC